MTTINKMHSTVGFSNKGTADLLNIEVDTVIVLISIPCPAWADRHEMAELLKRVGRERDLY